MAIGLAVIFLAPPLRCRSCARTALQLSRPRYVDLVFTLDHPYMTCILSKAQMQQWQNRGHRTLFIESSKMTAHGGIVTIAAHNVSSP